MTWTTRLTLLAAAILVGVWGVLCGLLLLLYHASRNGPFSYVQVLGIGKTVMPLISALLVGLSALLVGFLLGTSVGPKPDDK